jgi:hypothetical protein
LLRGLKKAFPYPYILLGKEPVKPSERAGEVKMLLTPFTSKLGFSSKIKATKPATAGEAMEVPAHSM